MTNQNRGGPGWQHIRPSQIGWEQFPDPHGRPTTPVRILKEGIPYVLEAQFPPHYTAGEHWHPFDTIYVFTQGEMRVGDEGTYRPGDVRWVRAGHRYGPEEAGSEGVCFFLISVGGPIGLNWADLYEVPSELQARLAGYPNPAMGARTEELAWQEFDDPHGRPTQPVQLIHEGDPYILRTRFAGDFSAAEHWHDWPTLYFITAGSMTFGDEGVYEAGDIRYVEGGFAYGPEQPGSDGVEFLLISLGGPVVIHWNDLEPAPHGALPV